jgi:hypothetical protein
MNRGESICGLTGKLESPRPRTNRSSAIQILGRNADILNSPLVGVRGPSTLDNDRNDDSSPADGMAALLRQQWRLIEGGKPMKVQRDNLNHSMRVDKRPRNCLKLLW